MKVHGGLLAWISKLFWRPMQYFSQYKTNQEFSCIQLVRVAVRSISRYPFASVLNAASFCRILFKDMYWPLPVVLCPVNILDELAKSALYWLAGQIPHASLLSSRFALQGSARPNLSNHCMRIVLCMCLVGRRMVW